MQTYAKFLIPASLFTGTLGAAVGYALHTSPPIACNAAVPADRISAAQKNEPLAALPWTQHPSLADSSWLQWPPLTDF